MKTRLVFCLVLCAIITAGCGLSFGDTAIGLAVVGAAAAGGGGGDGGGGGVGGGFGHGPGNVTDPSPEDGAFRVELNVSLSWSPAHLATKYGVYFGTSYPPPFLGNSTKTNYIPPALSDNTDYYWQVHAYNDFDENWGPIWSFRTGWLSSNTIYVSESNGSDSNFGKGWDDPLKTIGKAVEMAVDSDIILIADGIYMGQNNIDLDFNGKNLWVKSANGPQNCIIDCGAAGRGFYLHSGEGGGTVIDGFKIANGLIGDGNGGGIYCYNGSSPVINNCVIKDCTVTRVAGSDLCFGGGIACQVNSSADIKNSVVFNCTADVGGGISCGYSSNAEIRNCSVTSNVAYDGGGGISYGMAQPTIIDCIISYNDAPVGAGIRIVGHDDARIWRCFITHNTSGGGVFISNCLDFDLRTCVISHNRNQQSGGGLYITNGSDGIVCGCTIAYNTADDKGGGLFTESNGYGIFENTILWGSSSMTNNGHQCYASINSGVPFNLSCYQDGPNHMIGEIFIFPGCVTGYPNFVDIDNDLQLKYPSECIDAGSDGYLYTNIDILGQPRVAGWQVDIGAFEYQQ
ncbi:MAG: right-handed parallel beta-helix repeat-containing protein [Planctomycetota bacterium]|nr:MAG: right-handed parallel beta-helix repeat-containing protein [Planctomycetota bacterium]